MPSNHSAYTQAGAEQQFEKYAQLAATLRTQRLGEEYGRQLTLFVKFLRERTNFFSAPASTKYHLAVEGGLLMHSVAVCDTALALRETLMKDIPEDSTIICGLFHDVGKVYSKVAPGGSLAPRYEPNILKTGQSEAKPYNYVVDGNEIPLTIKDLMIPMKFMDLHDFEMQALLGADGQYVKVNEDLAHHEHPLTCLIHWADYWQGHVMEGGIQAGWLGGIFKRV